MLITVTQNHIDGGAPGDALFCPIALAIKDQLPDANVYVAGQEVIIDDDLTKKVYKLPESAQYFITNFDFDQPVKPFTFEI